MDDITAAGAQFTVSRADREHLPAILALLRDDVLGASREPVDPTPTDTHERAFEAITADPAHHLAVVHNAAGDVVGTAHLTLLPGLRRGGTLRLNIEAVRVSSSTRGTGLGAALIEWAHEWGRRQGATMAQLTSDKSRTAAHRFYGRLGYAASHEGFKRRL